MQCLQYFDSVLALSVENARCTYVFYQQKMLIESILKSCYRNVQKSAPVSLENPHVSLNFIHIIFRVLSYRAVIFAFHGIIKQNLDRVWQVFEIRPRSEHESLTYFLVDLINKLAFNKLNQNVSSLKKFFCDININ